MRTVQAALCLFALAFVVGHCEACKSPAQAEANAAESAYTLELLKCVDDAKTLLESRACRQQVNARWGINETGAGAK